MAGQSSTFGKCIELVSFHQDTRPASSMNESSNESPSEHPIITGLICEKYVDRTSANLLNYCLSAQLLGKGKDKPTKLHIFREYGDTTKSIITFSMRDALITESQFKPSSGDRLIEQFSLNFTEILWRYTHQNADGETLNEGSAGWSHLQNRAIAQFT